MNTPVNFEIAKLLKEKSFDKLSNFLWHFNGSDLIKMPNKNSENFGFSAPTIAEVVMWLYEKYGIWINAVPYGSSQTEWCFTLYSVNLYYDGKSIFTGPTLNSPTEAYKSAIKYCLENIINN